jgi:16S rRNA (cytidine1402-2'-O)-methyltransferase
LQNAMTGTDIGLLSEAGCPGVADPGAEVVALAHKKGIEVVPLVGPSSILLALMASGMNGQMFTFHGYLPLKDPERSRALKKLEQLAPRTTSIFIETPYRNQQMIETVLKTLQPHSRFCIAADLTLETEYVVMKTVGEWRKTKIPDLHKRPAIFLIG